MVRSDNNLTAVLQDTADAIRARAGTSASICPRDFAEAVAAIPHELLSPYAEDLTNGYMYKTTSIPMVYRSQDNINNRTDMFRVEAGKTYFFCNYDMYVKWIANGADTTDTYMTRWRAGFTTTDISQIPGSPEGVDTSMEEIVFVQSQAKCSQCHGIYTAHDDGYVCITKTNAIDESTGQGIGIRILFVEVA